MPNILEQHKKQLVYAACALVVLGGGYKLYQVLTAPKAPGKVVPVVRTVTVGAVDPAGSQVYPGAVHGRYESNLAFQVAGKIIARNVNLGDKVSAGQVLMTLDPKDVQQSVNAADAAVNSARSAQQLAQVNAERYRTLYAQSAVSKAVLDNYNTQLDAANAQLREAEAQAVASHNQLSYTQLTSDADGVVANITGEVGLVTSAGAVMVTVVRDGEREVQINVPENAMPQLKIGQPANISFWALDNTQQGATTGHIRDIASMADSLTKTYRVNVTIDNMPDSVQLGMTAKVTFTNAKVNNLVLPASAIYKAGDKTQVWVVKDKHVQTVDVTVAQYSGNDVLISQGLQPGDVVVTAGLSKLLPNEEVRLLETSASASAAANANGKLSDAASHGSSASNTSAASHGSSASNTSTASHGSSASNASTASNGSSASNTSTASHGSSASNANANPQGGDAK